MSELNRTPAFEEAPKPPVGRTHIVSAPWLQWVPFLLSGALFLSQLFVLFSPLPLLVLSLRSKRWIFILALLTNVALVAAVGGIRLAALFTVSTGVLSIVLPFFFFSKRASATRSVAMTVLAMVLASVGVLGGYSLYTKKSPAAAIHHEVEQIVQGLEVMSNNQQSEWPVTPEELQQMLIQEAPSLLATFFLIMAWVNLVLVLRMGGAVVLAIREGRPPDLSFLRTWKAPEFLVWPTILSGAAILFSPSEGSALGLVGLNLFRFLMGVYAIQGLCVCSFALDRMKVFGWLRSIVFIVLVWPLMSLLLAVGFFDLWFDFRSRFRQS